MRILVDIGHPAHVHVFKNMIWNLENGEHEVKIVARDKEFVLQLLDFYGFDYVNLGKNRRGLLRKAFGVMEFDYRLFRVARAFKPDLIISKGTPYAAHTSRLVGKPHIAFEDTEHAKISDLLTVPFTDVICTPACFKKKLDPRKHIRFRGYYALAYLHPTYFKPNPEVLGELNLSRDDRFFVLRFVSWEASHDIGHRGLTDRMALVRRLGKNGRVFITSERPLGGEFEKYRLNVPPERVHDLLYYASLYVGEGATMATEAGVLGTPSVYISSLVGVMGNFEELEKRYGLVYSFRDQYSALDTITSFSEDYNLKEVWAERRERMLKETVDVTAWMTELVANYPESIRKYVGVS